MDLSIIIVSYNVCAMLRDCLRALPEAAAGLTTEIFVVDNASADDSAAMVQREFPNVRLLASAENLGFAGGNNRALRDCAGRYALLLNPDTEPEPGSLTRLVAFMDAHPKAGACGPMLLNSDGSLQKNGGRFPTLLREFLSVTGMRRLSPAAFERRFGYGRTDFETACEVDQVSGACLLVRKETLGQVGTLDERFFMFYEETEWCRRMKAAGWQVWYVPQARVTHHWMGSVSQVSGKMTAQFFKSQLLYYKKTGGPLALPAAHGLMALGLLKNKWIQSGVAVKRALRRMGIMR